MKQIDLREGARRQHRAAALFAVVQCWLRDLDGLVFDRPDLQRLLGLERFKETRVDWMKKDFSEFFPYREVYWYMTGQQRSFASMFLSKRQLAGFLPKGRMTDRQRIASIPADGPRIGEFKIWSRPEARKVLEAFQAAIPFFADAANYDERLLASYLTLLSQGQISPRSLPPLEAVDGTAG